MPTLTPTKRTGARATPNPMLYVEPDRQVSDVTFLDDCCSGMLAHERALRKLLSSCAERSEDQQRRDRYAQMGDEVEQHLGVLEDLVTTIGGDPGYVGPLGRGTQAMDSHLAQSTFLGSGSMTPDAIEAVLLDAVFLGAAMSHANWSTLTRLGGRFGGALDDDMQARMQGQMQQVAEVEEAKDDHLAWAREVREQLVMTRAG